MPRSTLAPAAGALAGGLIAVSIGDAGTRLVGLYRDALAATASPSQLLRQAGAVLTSFLLPVLAAALAGALLAGLLQTRGYIGAPASQRRLPERASPGRVLAFLAWLSLAVLLLAELRKLPLLASGAEASAVASAAEALAGRMMRSAIIVVALATIVDHLLRVRARAARRGEARSMAVRRSAASVDPERFDALLAGVALVLVDEDVAIAIGQRAAETVVVLRARGLSARALIETARRRGVRIRPGHAGVLAARALGAPLSVAELAALGLPARRQGP